MVNKTYDLILYGSLGCHLCEEAEALLLDLKDIVFEKVEITDNEALLERYGIHIPVLKRTDNHQELYWPFNREQLSAFLDK